MRTDKRMFRKKKRGFYMQRERERETERERSREATNT
jgi:hypothetical protein